MVDTYGVLSIEEICDSAKNEKHEEAADNFHADVSEHTPMPSLSDAIIVFQTVRTFTYGYEITEKNQKMLYILKLFCLI